MPKKARARGSSAPAKKLRARWLERLAALRDAWLWPPLGLWLLAQLEPYVWLGALAAEAWLQLGLLSSLAALGALLLRRWLRAGAWIAGAALLLAPGWAFVYPARRTPEQGALLHVAQAHLDGAPLTRSALLSWLQGARVDVLSLTGVPASCLAELKRPIAGYSAAARAHAPRALLLVRAQLLPHPETAASATLRVARCEVELVQIQLPPLSARGELTTRERQLRVLSAADKKRRSLYVGHLGSRSGAHDLQPWLDAHGLRDARLGARSARDRAGATWRARLCARSRARARLDRRSRRVGRAAAGGGSAPHLPREAGAHGTALPLMGGARAAAHYRTARGPPA